MEVHTEVHRVLDAPHGSTLVLVPRVEDADWLNLNRPIFAQRELKIVLFCARDVTIALARHAVDFFDWISHRVECPDRPPAFAVAGLRCALSVRAPGILWRGEELEASLARARPRARLHHVSAAAPYATLLSDIQRHQYEWLAFHDVNSHFRLRRIRWALAEASRRTRVILVNPTVDSTGWWPIHARVEEPGEARTNLEKAGARFPGRLAALVEFEPEMVQWVCTYLEGGGHETQFESSLVRMTFPEVETQDDEEIDPQFASLLLQGTEIPPVMRAVKPIFRRIREVGIAALEHRLRDSEQVTSEEAGAWTAWKKPSVLELPALPIEYAVESWLRMGSLVQAQWSLMVDWIILLGDLDVAEVWAQRHLSKDSPLGRATLAHVRSIQGRQAEAESLVQSFLLNGRLAPDTDAQLVRSVAPILARMLTRKGHYQEAETMLRQLISTSPAEQDSFQATLVTILAYVLSAQNRQRDAESLLREALSNSTGSQSTASLSRMGQLRELARILSTQARYSEAESLLREALAVSEGSLGIENPLRVRLLQEMAESLYHQGRYSESEPFLRQALLIQETAGSRDHTYATSLSSLASSLREQGRYDEAEARQQEALDLERKMGGEQGPYTAMLRGMALIQGERGRYAEAEALLRQVLQLEEQAPDSTQPATYSTLSHLGITLVQQDRPGEGEPFIARALEKCQATLGAAHPETSRILTALAMAQSLAAKHEASETARQALEALNRNLGPDHVETQNLAPGLQLIIGKKSQPS